MAETVTSSLQVQLAAALTSTTGLGSASASFPLAALLANLTSGTGANKCNQIYYGQRTLASTANETLDIYNPATADALGNAFTIATVKMIVIQNTAAVEADSLTIGGTGSTAGWTSWLTPNTATAVIPGGGCFIAIAPGATGYVVGASTTNHQLKVLNNSASNSVVYNIWIIGATA